MNKRHKKFANKAVGQVKRITRKEYPAAFIEAVINYNKHSAFTEMMERNDKIYCKLFGPKFIPIPVIFKEK